MSHEELLADTNRLLTEYLRLQDERVRQMEESKAEFERVMSQHSQSTEMGAEKSPEVELEERMRAAQEASQKKMEELHAKVDQHREEVTRELTTQSELLAKIAAKLGA